MALLSGCCWKKPTIRAIFLFGLALLLFVTYAFLQLDSNQIQFEITKNGSRNDERITEPEFKTILYWNDFFGIEDFTFGLGREPFSRAQCPISTCQVTNDRSQFNASQVVVFSVQNLNLTDLPPHRFPHQRFVFFEMESPVNTDPQPMLDPRTRFSFFNWTMTYRLDSDIVQRDSYGFVVPRKPSSSGAYPTYPTPHQHRPNSSNISSGMTAGPASAAAASISGKKKLAAWFVSNCVTSIHREDYVKELGRHVPVDIYGRCGDLSCGDGCLEMIRRDYKFYVAFENSFCSDYVTEKLTRALRYGAVPVVMGGVDYNRFAPPHSFIDVRDFDSPEQLGHYLLLLNESDSLYGRYFEWKRHFRVQLTTKRGWCHLCKLANDDRSPSKTYDDIFKWWVDDPQTCNLNLGDTPIQTT